MNKNVSKGEALKELSGKLSLFRIPELLVLSVEEYLIAKNEVVNQIIKTFKGCNLAIRSSAYGEDGQKYALAGEYKSILNVSGSDRACIVASIDAVIESYKREEHQNCPDQVLVQRFLRDTLVSGVVFTHDLNTGAPYYVINYDDVSGLTNTVTSGDGKYANRTLFVHRNASESLRSERFQRLVDAVKELESVMNNQFLDIEFAITKDYVPHLLQVRAITTKPNWNRVVVRRVDAALAEIQAFVRDRFCPVPDVYGETTVLGQMPDWNPAEMIGRAPRALAFSLYKKLITDHAWRISRASMGYAVPTGRPLMVSLAGQPYIDTRLSFHSFIPAKLPPNIAEKLVNAWIRRLSEYPHLHDKVEFDVAITTYSFDFSEKLRALVGNTLTDEECQVYKCVLREQTRSLLMMGHEGSLANALQKINALLERQKKNNNLSGQNDISNLYKMLEDCIQLGTIPFSVLARHAFIAKTILMSLRHKGILTTQDVMCIQSSVRTVAGELVDDMHRMQLRDMAKEEFMSIYGHLRPGTYDILSRRYDQMTDFISSKPTFQAKKTEPEFNLSKRQRDEIDYLLEAEGFSELKAENIMDYLKESIAGREYAKFVFTRTVSDILELIAAYGERHCLSREEMSHISIDCLLEEMSRSGEGGLEERLRLIAAREAECHELTVAIRLPQVLFDEAGVHVIPFQVNHPNFITNKKVIAPVVVLEARADAAYHLAGKIILIENADPGFDWIFAQSIVGLITKYGGANSHMAIRCAEFGIAAAIGCGEQRYEAFVNSSQISMDCAAGLISPLH